MFLKVTLNEGKYCYSEDDCTSQCNEGIEVVIVAIRCHKVLKLPFLDILIGNRGHHWTPREIWVQDEDK